MRNYYFSILLLFLCSFNINSQGLETFEILGTGATSFTNNGYTFTVPATFDTEFLNDAGAGDSDYFLDNLDDIGINKTYTISLTGGATLFTMKTMEVYVSSHADASFPTDDGTMTFTGKIGSTIVFTYTKSSGFPTTLADPANGYFKLNFAALPGVGDVSSMNIDRLEISHAGAFQYTSIDNFEFGAEVLNTDPPVVNSITLNSTPPTTATSISYTVIFNENANNVTTDDFLIDAFGTSGNIASVSGSGTTYTVTINNISGEGTISLDLEANTNIADDLGNSPPPPFTNGTIHTVSRCFIETFESVSAGSTFFASNGVNFTTATSNFSVEFLNDAGAADSDHFLSNKNDQGTGKKYSIKTSGGELFTVDDMEMYLSSITDGTTPTNDGSLIVRGKLTGSTLFTITKSSGFPTTHTGADNGFFILDFATAGSSDYSLTNIDELEIELGGAFKYIGLDNFDHCEASSAANPPIVQNIKLIGNPVANATTVDYQVVFNESAVNVTTDDFLVTTTGTAMGTVNSISGSGNTYTVNINGISGEGSIRLDLKSGTNIADTDGNTPPDPYISGQVHLVTSCKVETFEALANDSFSWTTGFIPFTTGTSNFKVKQFDNAGAGGSDRFLDNTPDQGTGKTYSISITNTDIVNMGSMEVYVSSETNGTTPTNDGTLTVKGKLDGVEQFSVTKSSGFPNLLGSTQGFFTWNFVTEGGTDYSTTDVDEIEVTLGGAFRYIAIDNFKYCEYAYDCSDNRLYVHASATGNNNGSDWTNAYISLQSALTHTQYCSNINEIWVASGVYKPMSETTPISIPADMQVYGGFDGTETTLDERKTGFNGNITYLSGDISNIGSVGAGDTHTIVKTIGDNIVIDGFFIESSYADDNTVLDDRAGGGIFVNSNNVTLSNNVFRFNNAPGSGADGVGGALIVYGTDLKLINNIFYNNTASNAGGAISPQTGTASIINNTFVANTAPIGGAIHIYNVNSEIVNCIFADNTAATSNPDINNYQATTVNLSYSILKNTSLPTAGGNGGGVTEGTAVSINTDPSFLNGAYELDIVSLAINAGNSASNTNSKDIIGNPRKVGIIDIGAYEYKDETTRWTGATDTNWVTNINWSNGEPTETKIAVIPNGVTNMPVITTGSKKVLGLYIDTNANLELQTQTGLTVEENITTNNKLTLNADASLIAKGSVIGTITYKRSVSDTWHLVGAPVENQGIESFVQNVENKIKTNTAGDKYGIAPYNNNKPSDQVGWDYVLVADLASSGNFINGKGYSMLRAETGDYIFRGNYKTTNASINIVEGTKNSWNLIANPYPAFLPISNSAAVSNFLTENQGVLSSNLAVYLWDGTQYKPYNHLNTSTAYLAPGQGFFVESNAGGGTISIPKSFMEHQTTDVFHRNTNSRFEIELILEYEEKNKKVTKSTDIIYMEDTTTDLDIGYDAEVFSAESKKVDIYTHLVNSNGKAYALQGLPSKGYEKMVVPIGIVSDENKNLKFKLNSKNIPEGINIFLEDKLEETFTRLQERDDEYTITTAEPFLGTGRFYLHTSTKDLTIKDLEPIDEKLKIYLSDKRRLEIKGVEGEKAVLHLYDLLGKEVFKYTFTIQDNNSINLPKSLVRTVYIANLKTESSFKTTKLILE